jgi:hypothetical protein
MHQTPRGQTLGTGIVIDRLFLKLGTMVEIFTIFTLFLAKNLVFRKKSATAQGHI